MANAKVGVKSGWHSNFVETITEAKTLVPSDSGKLFNVTAGNFAITLPKATPEIVGFSAEFVITTGANTALTIVSKEADDLYYGGLITVTGIVSSTSDATNGRLYQPDGTDDRILTLDNDLDGNGFDKGSHMKVQCIAENKWLWSGHLMVAAAEDDDTSLAPFS
tara:strand:+ start:538 stop:1029 length:492 start_codon:yes stop_codon:yes gene_type:complete